MTAHGYGTYTNGCRCDVCRKAKADYMRERRRAAREKAMPHTTPISTTGDWTGAVRYYVPGIKHASSYAWFERGCRCFDCTEWKSQGDLARQRRRRPA